MTNKEILMKEIEKISDDNLQEIIDFVRFIKSCQVEEDREVTLLSQSSSLAKDWLKPEEDEAWKDL